MERTGPSVTDFILDDEIVTFDDGFKYFWPITNRGGFSSHNLREIADHLDQLNKKWSLEIEEYFLNNP